MRLSPGHADPGRWSCCVGPQGQASGIIRMGGLSTSCLEPLFSSQARLQLGGVAWLTTPLRRWGLHCTEDCAVGVLCRCLFMDLWPGCLWTQTSWVKILKLATEGGKSTSSCISVFSPTSLVWCRSGNLVFLDGVLPKINYSQAAGEHHM